MYFVLSKIFGFFALPSNALLMLGLVGIALQVSRYAWIGRRLVVAFILLFAVLGYSPIGSFLLYQLENRFPMVWDFPGDHPDGIIVLGGAIDPDANLARKRPVFVQGAERISAAAELAELFPAARIVFTGGSSRLAPGGVPESDVAVPLLEKLGVPRERILVESRARNTFENALLTKALVAPKAGERWLLVTSASHMPRAVGAFRRVGFPVESYSVDRRMFTPLQFWPQLSAVAGLFRLDEAVREWLGLLAYWLAGYTSELYPAPTAWDLRNLPEEFR